jgi:hypothetical protein
MAMTEKKCSKCGEWKSLSDFSKDKKAKDGYQYKCKVCVKEYRKDNQEHILEYYRKWQKENNDKCIKRTRKWRKANPEYCNKWYQENPEYHRQWAKDNPEKRRAYRAKRRAIKVSTTTTDPWELQQIAIFYGECPEGWHVDHILPLALGGHHELSNLQYLEAWMNLSKYDKHPDDWDDPRPISCRA